MDWEQIRAGIFAGESGGDYDALFGYSNRPGQPFADVRLTDMTVNDALQFADPQGPYAQWVRNQVGRVATPMGAYQVVGTTLRDAMQGMNLTGNERMTPELQEQIGRWIYERQGTGAWEGYRGPQDPSTAPPVPQGQPQQQNALAESPGPEPFTWQTNMLDPAAFQSRRAQVQQPQFTPNYLRRA